MPKKLTVMEKKNKEIISARLRKLRKNRGISQEELRECTGIDVSKYETGERFPRIDTLLKISSFFEVQISYFFQR